MNKEDRIRLKQHEEIKRFLIDVSWHHLLQRSQSNIFWRLKTIVSFLKLLATGIASSGLIALLFTDEQWLQITTTLISLLVFIVNGISKEYNYSSLYKRSNEDATALLSLREQALELLYDVTYDLKESSYIERKYNEMVGRREELYSRLLPVTNTATRHAKKVFYSENGGQDGEWDLAEEKAVPDNLRQCPFDYSGDHFNESIEELVHRDSQVDDDDNMSLNE